MLRDESSGDLLDMLRRYLRQETVDPLRAVGRFLLFGASGSLLIGSGLVLIAVGGLRSMQAWGVLEESWSWVPYIVVATALSGLAVLAVSRIGGERGLDA
jgi:hypothetical protein